MKITLRKEKINWTLVESGKKKLCIASGERHKLAVLCINLWHKTILKDVYIKANIKTITVLIKTFDNITSLS